MTSPWNIENNDATLIYADYAKSGKIQMASSLDKGKVRRPFLGISTNK
jgi:hypothetical protein